MNATLYSQGMKVNKTDYAANGGTSAPFTEAGPGLACLANYPDPNSCQWTHDTTWMYTNFTGVVALQSEIRKITNGLGQTYFAGEKYLDPSYYTTGPDPSDAGCCTQGHDYNVIRFCTNTQLGGNIDLPPMPDTANGDLTAASLGGSARSGSAHATGLNFVFCDGAVHWITYLVDPLVYTYMANRNNRTIFTPPF